MEIRESKQDAVVVLGLTGRLDAESVGPLQNRLQELIGVGEIRFAIEIAGLNYMSSSGIRLFLETAKRLEPQGGRVVLFALQDPVRRVLEMAGLAALFNICATREEAVGRCREPGTSARF